MAKAIADTIYKQVGELHEYRNGLFTWNDSWKWRNSAKLNGNSEKFNPDLTFPSPKSNIFKL